MERLIGILLQALADAGISCERLEDERETIAVEIDCEDYFITIQGE